MNIVTFSSWRFALSAALTALAVTGYAADDSNRDHSFGGPAGYATQAFDYSPNGIDFAADLAVYAEVPGSPHELDGRVVLAGYAAGTLPGDVHGAVARFLSDGRRDTTFNSGHLGPGRAVFRVGTDDTYVTAVALQPNKKIVVAGEWRNMMASGGFVARLNADGMLDPSFGLGGIVRLGQYPIADVVVQSGATTYRILAVSAIATASFGDDMVVYALTPGGSPDTMFATGGQAMIDFTPAFGAGMPPATDHGSALALQPDGHILVAGHAYPGMADQQSRFAVARLLAHGVLDSSFGTDGRQTVAFEWCNAVAGDDPVGASAVAVASDGRIVLGGRGASTMCSAEGVNITALAALDPDGTLDASFGDAGKLARRYFIASGFESNEQFGGLAIEPNGHILLAGHGVTDASGLPKIGVARLLPNGDLDPSFAGDGIGQYDLDQDSTFGSAIALQGDRPIVAGMRFPDPGISPLDSDFLAVRIVSDRLFADDFEFREFPF